MSSWFLNLYYGRPILSLTLLRTILMLYFCIWKSELTWELVFSSSTDQELTNLNSSWFSDSYCLMGHFLLDYTSNNSLRNKSYKMLCLGFKKPWPIKYLAEYIFKILTNNGVTKKISFFRQTSLLVCLLRSLILVDVNDLTEIIGHAHNSRKRLDLTLCY